MRGHIPKDFSVGGVVCTADEEHRAATPLELLFDLCFVVAVAQAAAGLHELLVERRFADGVIGFVTAFFSIWWAWVNVVWFATGHDSEDVIHRLMTLVQMAGALILAAGVHSAMTDLDLTTSVVGYVVMRLGIVPLWLRVGRDQPAQRERCYRYATTIVIAQTYWVLRASRFRTTRRWRSPAWPRESCSSSWPRSGPNARRSARTSTAVTSPSASGCSPSSCSAR